MMTLQSPLIIKSLGSPLKMTLEERLKRCDLELLSVLKLNDQTDMNEVELRNLSSVFIDKNPDFVCLVEEITNWNRDIKEYKEKGKPILKPGILFYLIKSLNNNLREVVNTKDRQVQLCYLKQLKTWYFAQKNSFILKGTQTSSQSRPNTSGGLQSALSFRSLMKPLKAENSLEDFFTSHRSKHEDIAPPEDRIKEFSKKEFNKVYTPSVDGTRPGTVMLNTSRPMTQASTARTLTNFQSARALNTFENSPRGVSRGGLASSQTQYRDDADKERLRSPGANSNSSPWNYTGSLGFFQDKGQFQTIKLERFQSTDAAEEQNSVQDGQEEQVDGSSSPKKGKEPKQEFQQQRRKIYTSDSNSRYTPQIRPQGETRSIYLHYAPSHDLEEMKLERMWLQNRNKAVQERREAQELENHIKNWANNKGLVDQEINRKNELIKEGSKFMSLGRQNTLQKEVLTESNYQQKELTTEEVEEKNQFDNYLSIMRLPVSEKEKMAHPQINDDSLSEIIKINRSVKTPKSQMSEGENQDINFDNILEQAMTETKSKEPIKNGHFRQNSDRFFDEGRKSVTDRPNTNYLPLRNQIKTVTPDQNPFLDLEKTIKRKKIDQLRQQKSKIIGNFLSKPNDEVDDEEVQRRKQSSLQTYFYQNPDQKLFKPFTSFYKKLSLDTLQFEEINEIQKVRKSFARKGIKCSLRTIQNSLTRPQGLPQKELRLPTPGSMLFSSPFDNFGKKKRASKKKK